MKLFHRGVRALFFGSAVLCSVLLLPASAQTASPKLADSAIMTAAEANRLIGGPTLITLHFKNAPLRVVIEALAKQAGIKLRTMPEEMWQQEHHTVTVNIDHQPYWLAVREISKSSNLNLSVSRWSGQSVWNLTQTDELNGPYVWHSPFLIVATAISRDYSSSLRFGGKLVPQKSRTAQISVSAFADPKLQLIGYASNIELEQVLDEKGNSFKPANPLESPYRFWPASNQTFFASLNIPSQAGKRIAKFRGSLRFLQSRKSIVWEVPDIMNVKDAEKTVVIGGVTTRYVINSVEKTGNEYQVRVTIFYNRSQTPNPLARKGRYPFAFLNDTAQFMRLLGAQGQQFVSAGYGSRGGSDLASVDVSFAKSDSEGRTITGEPTKLIMEFPTNFTEIKVPVEFTDLPLP